MDFVSKKLSDIDQDKVSWGEIVDKINAEPYNAAYRYALSKSTENEDNIVSSSIFNNRLSSNAMLKSSIYDELDNLTDVNIAPSQKIENLNVSPKPNIIDREENLPDWIEKNIPETQEELPTPLTKDDITYEISENKAFNEVAETDDMEIVANVEEPITSSEEKIFLAKEKPIDSVYVKNEIVEMDKVLLRKVSITDEISQSEPEIKKKKKSKKKRKGDKFLLGNTTDIGEFNDWLLQLKPLKEGNIKRILKKGKKKEKSEVERSAADSITKKKYIASEPLAKILASQGHILEAIEMYKQISLTNPKKNAYFAAQIEELKKRL